MKSPIINYFEFLIRKLVVENDFNLAFRILEVLAGSQERKNEVTFLYSGFNFFEHQRSLGVLQLDEYILQSKKNVVMPILDLTDKILEEINVDTIEEKWKLALKAFENVLQFKITQIVKKYEISKDLHFLGLDKSLKNIIEASKLSEAHSKSSFDEPSFEVRLSKDDAVKRLAKELAFNHAVISFGDRYEGDSQNNSIDQEVIGNIFDTKIAFQDAFQYKRSRNVVVIGAGATYDAFPMLPFGKEMLDMIFKELESDLKNILKESDKSLDDVKMDVESMDNFESRLSYLALILDKDRIREVLQKYYKIRYAPNLSYEIIAHMLKNGFIDVVINYNFDELLDQAIEEEVGEGNFYKIVSDGDCIDIENILVDGRIKVPIYIKVHGTASHKSSFDIDDDYVRIPPDIFHLVGEILRGSMGKNSKNRVSKVNLICIGFSMLCKQLNMKLNEIMHHVISDPNDPLKGFNIFHINHEFPKPAKKFRKFYSDNKNEFFLIDPRKYYIEDSPYNPLSSCLQSIWNEIPLLFNTPLQPRGIQRHQFISELFYDFNNYRLLEGSGNLKKLEQRRVDLIRGSQASQYHYERVLAEMAITISRNKGLVDPKQSMAERLGMYYKLYRTFYIKEIEKEETKSKPKSIYNFLVDVFNMEEKYSFSRNVFNLKPLEKTEFNNWNKSIQKLVNVILGEEHLSFDKAKERFNKNIGDLVLCRLIFFLSTKTDSLLWKNIFSLSHENPKDYERKIERVKRIKSYVSVLSSRLLYDIQPKFDDNKLYIFDSFRKKSVLHTDLALTYEFINIFRNPDAWDILLVASERGRFISEVALQYVDPVDKEKILNKKIINICCSQMMLQTLADHEAYNEYNSMNFEKQYKKLIIENNDNNRRFKQLKVLSLPYTHISHHIAFFLPKIEESNFSSYDDNFEGLLRELFKKSKCLYYYKPCLSYKINPILLNREIEKEKLKREDLDFFLMLDFKMVLETFLVLFLKAEVFSRTKNLELFYDAEEIRFKLKPFLYDLYLE